VPETKLEISPATLGLRFPPGWLELHPLTRADLDSEAEYLHAIDLRLSFA
jgi:exopolyphosphatase/guanosine-5'-triphosphate,3'-diphosphate pyrophosphatase